MSGGLTERQNKRITKDVLEVFSDEFERALRGVDWEGLIDTIQVMFDPEDVFDESALANWAEEHGYTKEEAKQ